MGSTQQTAARPEPYSNDHGSTSATLDVLAALASLGINEQLRTNVQHALEQLEVATARARQTCQQDTGPDRGFLPALPISPKAASVNQTKQQQTAVTSIPSKSGDLKASHNNNSNHNNDSSDNKSKSKLGGKTSKPGQLQPDKGPGTLEQKLVMSRSIMRKLYYRNVELEKELQVLRANSSPISFSTASDELLKGRQINNSAGAATQEQAAGAGDVMFKQALQERDAAVAQLQQALDAARRRCALLESQLNNSNPAASQAAPSSTAALNYQNARDVVAQSHLHYSKYKQIRDDYNRLLNRRAATLQTNKAASEAARAIVGALQTRLQQEVSEREAEAALYNAKLYETEKQMSDWYVERRMLEEHIARLSNELVQRDQVDREIETCMCGLLDRLKQLESTNQQLRFQLGITSGGIAGEGVST